MTTNEEPFGFWRSLLWPVHRHELKKILSMLLLMSCLCISYSIMRNLKDSVILTAPNSGAEVIPFIKVWGMLPAAILATWIYSKLRTWFNREQVFYLIVGGFVSYFLLFVFVLYPNSEALNFNQAGNFLREHLPSGFSGLIAMMCNWTYTLHYVLSELWSVVVLTVLFWGFANDVTTLPQAKRCYGILNLGSNMAPFMGGLIVNFFIQKWMDGQMRVDSNNWYQTMVALTLLVCTFASLAMAIFYWIHRRVLPHEPHVVDSHAESVKKSKKKRLSLRDCIRYISKSRYLTCLALIVLGFNVAINFTDVLWKAQLKKHFSDPGLIFAHMNQVTMGIGLVATIGGLLFSILVRRLGWTFVAILTPAVMMIMAIGFFGFLFFESSLTTFALSVFGMTPLALTVYFGSIQNCLSKAGKYSVFDASKELALLALDSESRIRGKAAIDGLGSGVGKSGSSLTYQALLLGLGSLSLCTPFIAVILAVVFVAWIYSVFFVAKEFNTKSGAASEETLESASTTS